MLYGAADRRIRQCGPQHSDWTELLESRRALSKETRVPSISEDFTVQFRAEFFNVPNHPSFATPNSNLYTQGTNGTFLPNASVNRITGTTSQPRQVQFGLKLLF